MDHIKPALKSAGNGPHRIAVLKSVYSWLRKEKHLLTVNDDSTFQTLVVPQARPEQWKRAKMIPREHYLLAREHLAPHWRDGMDVQGGTGWHVTELIRFAKGTFGREKYGMAVVSACKAAGIPSFTHGKFRHSVVTWAIEKDADPASVAVFLNHKSPRTTMRFYATHAIPKKIPTLCRRRAAS